ncbi:MAG: MMPL family transporter [Termitinemataceae bacterium]|nr:MAG: MMPL family transporter [Termitinemataceae bacterium]
MCSVSEIKKELKEFCLGKKSYLAWIIFHILVLAVFAASLFSNKVGINSDLMDILPESSEHKAESQADKILAEKMFGQATVLVEGQDFETAKEAAEVYAGYMESTGDFKDVVLYIDTSVTDEIKSLVFENRYNLLDSETINTLNDVENFGPQEIADEAIDQFYSAFNFTIFDDTEKDPFFLSDNVIQNYFDDASLINGKLKQEDGVLTTEKDDKYYVLIRINLMESGFSGSTKSIENFFKYKTKLKEQYPNVDIFFSGTAFYSYENSRVALREISIISYVSLSLVLVLFLLVFRSLYPALLSMFASLLSLGAACAGTFGVFHEIHILTFIFGTTLIGVSVDHSIHYFTHLKMMMEPEFVVRRKIFRAMTMSFFSTEICFAVLLFSPIILLKQFAVFSILGLASSWLTVLFLFPNFKIQNKARLLQDKPIKHIKAIVPSFARRIILSIFIVAACIFIVVFRSNIRINNDLNKVWKLSESQAHDDKVISDVVSYGAVRYYFIVSGDTEEEMLQNEETFRNLLDDAIADDKLKNYLALSKFIPSEKAQRLSYAAAENLQPFAKEQFKMLDMDETALSAWIADFDSKKNKIATTENISPAVQKLLYGITIGEYNKKYYSCVMPLHPSVSKSELSAMADNFPFVTFINKIDDMSIELDNYTIIMLKLFLVAFLLIIVSLKLFYSWKQTTRICFCPIIITICLIAVLSVINEPVEFFTTSAFVLVFGLSLDYILYITEDEKSRNKNNYTIYAITFSFITTALSFGALAFSSFLPVHTFGLTIFIGIIPAFCSSMLLRK